MNKWMIFLKERAPVMSYFLMCLGPTMSSFFLNQKHSDAKIIISFFGLFIFFNVLRMMDEYKDYHKDMIAHPTRPLPRGLINLNEFKKGIYLGLLVMLLLDFLMLYLGLYASFFLYSFVIVHLWLMYKEFYFGNWLNQFPLIYAISHQLILIPLMLFALSTLRIQELSFTLTDWIYALSVLFSFFTYEICRKLDPDAHELLKTYRFIYGLGGVLVIVCFLTFFQGITLFLLYKSNPLQIALNSIAITIIVMLYLHKAKR